MASYNIYYLPYSIEKKVDYTFIFYLYGIAQRDINGGIKSIINYSSIKELQEKINRKYSNDKNSIISISTISRNLNKKDYEEFFYVEDRPDGKRIVLQNNFCGVKGQPYVRLTPALYHYLIEQNDNLLSKYVIYLIYWCGIGSGKTDFTADQFLQAIGYSTKSNNQKEKLCLYNNALSDREFIKIQKSLVDGKYRNTYYLIQR